MANDQKLANRTNETIRSVTSGVEQMGQKAAETSARMGDTAASTGAKMSNDFVKMFADLRLPGMMDMQSFMDAHRRNLETLSAANRVAIEGAQTVARRQMEIIQQSMQDLGESMRHMSSADAPQAKASRQAELLKASYERAVENMRELRDLIQRSNGEAVELLNRRFMESMDEVKALMDKVQSQARPV